MLYHNLQDLIGHSQSCRIYFFSLPTATQMRLHAYGNYITSAHRLHTLAAAIESNTQMDILSSWE